VQNTPAVAILSLGAAVPGYQARQCDVAQWMIASFGDSPTVGRLLRSIYACSGIDTRYTCIDDYLHPVAESRFAPGQPLPRIATTAQRMAIYEREAPPLGVAAARAALADLARSTNSTQGAILDSITHLVVVSCTGFFAPGLDLAIARQLALPSVMGRMVIGFMGCAAAFNGLQAAAQLVRSQPNARVLLVCVELCSLHIQPGAARENLIAGSLFADGASACIVGQPLPGQHDLFLIDQFFSQLKPDSQDDMVWRIGDHGFALRLSPQVPRHLSDIAPPALRRLFSDKHEVAFWAIHPGGPAIIDRLAQVFALDPHEVAASRAILRCYGNLSSATILFVLDEIRQQFQQQDLAGEPQSGVAMAFGPGLVIEMARLTYLPACVQQTQPSRVNHPDKVTAL
jgi:predicted naringenin-chalcone synthase